MFLEPIKIDDSKVESEEIDYKKFIVDNDYIDKDLDDFVDGNMVMGYTIGVPCFDDYYVAKKFEFYGVTGKKGKGKTTMEMFKHVAHSIANNLVWVVAFQENADWGMKLNYMNYILGDFAKNVRRDNPDLYLKAKKWVNEHFIFLRVETIKEALETTKAIIEKEGIDVHAVLLDPINSFDSGYYNSGNSHQDMVDTTKKILRHANDVCSVYATQHPTMSGQRQEGDVNSFDAEGGAILNKASFTYAYNRNKGESVNRLSIDNVRNRHTGGNETEADNAVTIYWSPTKIHIGNEERGEIEYDVIGNLKRFYNPLDEVFEEKQPETIPVASLEDAFDLTDNDIKPFELPEDPDTMPF